MDKRISLVLAVLIVALYLGAGAALSYRELGWASACFIAAFVVTGYGFRLKRKHKPKD